MIVRNTALFGMFFTCISLSGALLEENRGQFSREVAFLTSNGGVEAAVTDRGISFRSSRAALELRFEGANRVNCAPDSPISGQANYLGRPPSITHANQYSSLICPELYRGIDWAIHTGAGSLEHDWRIAAGADSGAISMRLDESASPEILANGDLRFSSGELKIVWKAPKAYQDVDGTRRTVAVKYSLAGRRITLVAGEHRGDRSWVIDPLIDFTYVIAGNADTVASLVALDGAGNIYLAGYTTATNFAATTGAVFPTGAERPYNPVQNAFVRKLSPDGSKVIYSTYLGAIANPASLVPNRPVAMRVDSTGNVYVAAVPDNSIPPPGEPGTAGAVGIYKLAPGGDRLLYGIQLLPGPDRASLGGLAIDSTGAAYVAMVIRGTISVAKVDSAGVSQPLNSPVFGSAFSGSLVDIALGPDVSIYLAGTNFGGWLLTTPGSFQTQPASPNGMCGFVIRMKPDGSRLVYSTYVSGQYSDTVTSLFVDGAGAAYVGGQTNSYGAAAGLPGMSLGVQAPLSTSGYVLKLDPTGSNVLFTALLPVTTVNALTFDTAGHIYAAGIASSGLTLSKIDVSGSELLYHSTIATPTTTQFPNISLAVDSTGAAYLASSILGVRVPDLVQSSRLFPNALLLKMDPIPDQTDLSITASPSQPLLPQMSAPLQFTIRNNGTADATAVVFSATGSVGAPAACRVSGSGVCGADATHIRAVFDSIPAGGSETVEVAVVSPTETNVSAVVRASVSTLTSDVTQDNNYSHYSSGSEALKIVSFMVVPGAVGATCTITSPTSALPCGPNPVYEVSGDPVTIAVPSPQEDPFGRALIFTKWSDGSTDNPRTIIARAGLPQLVALFTAVDVPYIAPSAVTNAGSYAASGVAPGELVTLFGSDLAAYGYGVVKDGRFPDMINSTSVTFDAYPAPLIFGRDIQINAIVPYEIAGQSSTSITVHHGNVSASITVPVVEAVPALFSANGSGKDQAAALNPDSSANSPSNPANPGDVIVLYGTGAGLVNSPPPNGTIAGSPLSAPKLAIAVTIGGAPARVLYAGDAPGLVSGVLQINAVIPPGITYSHHVPVKWSAGNFSSPDGLTIAVNDSVIPPAPVQGNADDLSKSPVSVSPSHVVADSSSTKFLVSGKNFTAGMVVNWNGIPAPTTFVNSTVLQVVIPAVYLEPAGLGWISVWDAGHTTQISRAVPVVVYVPVQNRDMVYDRLRSRFYVAVAAGQKPQGSSIAVLNPRTQRLEKILPLSEEPARLAISDDDQYLYVAAGHLVTRIDLAAWSVGPSIDLGPLVANSLRVLPGANTALVVAGTGFVSVYDGVQMRPDVFRAFAPITLIGGPDDSVIYATDGFGSLLTFAVSSAGLSLVSELNGLIGISVDAIYANGLIYDGVGAIVDPVSQVVVGTFDNQGPVLPLTDLGLALVLGAVPPPGRLSVASQPLSLNAITGGTRYWSLAIPTQFDLIHGPILRWDRNGVALREPDSSFPNISAGVDLFQVDLSVIKPGPGIH